MKRVQQLIQADQAELNFLWEIRQRDFYGDSAIGALRTLPSDRQVRKSLSVARKLIDRIAKALA